MIEILRESFKVMIDFITLVLSLFLSAFVIGIIFAILCRQFEKLLNF